MADQSEIEEVISSQDISRANMSSFLLPEMKRIEIFNPVTDETISPTQITNTFIKMGDHSEIELVISGQGTVEPKVPDIIPGEINNVKIDPTEIKEGDIGFKPIEMTDLAKIKKDHNAKEEMIKNKEQTVESLEKEDPDVETEKQDVEQVFKEEQTVEMIKNEEQAVETVDKNNQVVDIEKQDVNLVESLEQDVKIINNEEQAIEIVDENNQDVEIEKQDVNLVESLEQDVEHKENYVVMTDLTGEEDVEMPKLKEKDVEMTDLTGEEDVEMPKFKEKDVEMADLTEEETAAGQGTVEGQEPKEKIDKSNMTVIEHLVSLAKESDAELKETMVARRKARREAAEAELLDHKKAEGAGKRSYPYDSEQTEMNRKEPLKVIELSDEEDVITLSE